jgi:hypothetical protein
VSRPDRWVIDPPAEHDPGMARDGIAAAAPPPAPRRLLEEVVARTPLDTWTAPGAPPADVLAMPATEEWAPAFRRGLARPRWPCAVGGVGGGAGRSWSGRPPTCRHDDRPCTAAAAGAGSPRTWRAAAQRPRGAARLLDDLPGPWPEPLAEAVVDALTRWSRGSTPVWHLRELCSLAAPALPVGWAPRWPRLAEHTAATTRARAPPTR